MKNKKLGLSLVVMLIGILSILLFNSASSIKGKNELATRTKKTYLILIDPGHGGIDGGAISKSGTKESDINLFIGKMLKMKLEALGYKVILSREDDRELCSDRGTIRAKKLEDLKNRCKLKEECGCDMFVSIHLNKFPQEKYYGAQVWYSKNQESGKLAHIIQVNLKKDIQNGNKRVEKPALDGYKILRCHDVIPSVIVECGFISNNEEEKLLKTSEYQEKLADSLGNSIEEYFNGLQWTEWIEFVI